MNSRSAFIKKASLAVVSIFGIGLAGFSFRKQPKRVNIHLNKLTVDEANEIIKTMPAPVTGQIKPEQPPVENHN